jgi:hypothetical protein
VENLYVSIHNRNRHKSCRGGRLLRGDEVGAVQKLTLAATELLESLLPLATGWTRFGGFYGSNKQGLVLATAGALMIATLVSLGAVYGFTRTLDPDEFASERSTP